jgi:chaperone LolA
VKFARLLLTSVLVAVATPALAEEPAPAASAQLSGIVDSVEQKYAKVTTIEAGFTQVKKDAFGKIQQDGDVILKRPTKMRWRFTSGDESEFVTDGSTLWIYTKADNQVLQIEDTSQATSTANTFLTSLDSLDETFVIRLLSNTAGPTFDLVPRKPGMYKNIRLSLTPELVLSRVIFTDAYDNVTDISFRDVKLNGTVDDSVFVFKVPTGATVLKN